MEEYFLSVIDSNQIPLLTACLLGLLASMSPCTFTTNVMVLGFLGKEISNGRQIFVNGLMYTLGRIVSFTLLGIFCLVLLKKGASTFHVQKFMSEYGGYVLAPTLLLFALFLVWGSKLPLQKFGFHATDAAKRHQGMWGAFILGLLFALAFCPVSGMLYFVMLLPMAAIEPASYVYPGMFAIASSILVVVLAWIFAFSISRLSSFYNKVNVMQKYLNWLTAALFFAASIYEFCVYYLGMNI